MGRPDYIFGQFRETARCRDAQHWGGVCCACAPQLVLNFYIKMVSFEFWVAIYRLAAYFTGIGSTCGIEFCEQLQLFPDVYIFVGSSHTESQSMLSIGF